MTLVQRAVVGSSYLPCRKAPGRQGRRPTQHICRASNDEQGGRDWDQAWRDFTRSVGATMPEVEGRVTTQAPRCAGGAASCGKLRAGALLGWCAHCVPLLPLHPSCACAAGILGRNREGVGGRRAASKQRHAAWRSAPCPAQVLAAPRRMEQRAAQGGDPAAGALPAQPVVAGGCSRGTLRRWRRRQQRALAAGVWPALSLLAPPASATPWSPLNPAYRLPGAGHFLQERRRGGGGIFPATVRAGGAAAVGWPLHAALVLTWCHMQWWWPEGGEPGFLLK